VIGEIFLVAQGIAHVIKFATDSKEAQEALDSTQTALQKFNNLPLLKKVAYVAGMSSLMMGAGACLIASTTELLSPFMPLFQVLTPLVPPLAIAAEGISLLHSVQKLIFPTKELSLHEAKEERNKRIFNAVISAVVIALLVIALTNPFSGPVVAALLITAVTIKAAKMLYDMHKEGKFDGIYAKIGSTVDALKSAVDFLRKNSLKNIVNETIKFAINSVFSPIIDMIGIKAPLSPKTIENKPESTFKRSIEPATTPLGTNQKITPDSVIKTGHSLTDGVALALEKNDANVNLNSNKTNAPTLKRPN
jgi:cytochrome c oxidase assembly factor CtaG